MKTKHFLFASLVMLVLSAWAVPPTGLVNKIDDSVRPVPESKSGVFSFFRTHRQGRYGIASSWGAVTTTGITGFILQRTYEFPDEFTIWENIYEVNAANRSRYQYLDENVFPGIVSYRVLAVNNTNPVFVSEISAVQIRQH